MPRLPVVDSNGVLVGIVTQDDMLDVAEEEATEDIQKIGGMEALDEPYMRIPLWRMVTETRGLADHSLSRRNADRHGDGKLPGGNSEGGGPGDVFAADYFQRRQFRFAGVDPDDSRDGFGRSDVCAIGGASCAGKYMPDFFWA